MLRRPSNRSCLASACGLALLALPGFATVLAPQGTGTVSLLSFNPNLPPVIEGAITPCAQASACPQLLLPCDPVSLDATGHAVPTGAAASSIVFYGDEASYSSDCADASGTIHGRAQVTAVGRPSVLDVKVAVLGSANATADFNPECCPIAGPECAVGSGTWTTSDPIYVAIPFHVSQPCQMSWVATLAALDTCGPYADWTPYSIATLDIGGLASDTLIPVNGADVGAGYFIPVAPGDYVMTVTYFMQAGADAFADCDSPSDFELCVRQDGLVVTARFFPQAL